MLAQVRFTRSPSRCPVYSPNITSPRHSSSATARMRLSSGSENGLLSTTARRLSTDTCSAGFTSINPSFRALVNAPRRIFRATLQVPLAVRLAIVSRHATTSAELIVEMAAANGYGDVIEVLHVDARDLPQLDPAPNVVVSEMLGHFAPDEDQHHLYRLAAQAADDDAVFIPSSYTVELALADAADFRWEMERLQNYRGIQMQPLVRRLFNRTHLAAHDPSMLLSNEASTAAVASTAPRPDSYACQVQVHRAGVANAIVASFTAQLSPSVQLRTNVTQPKTHWQQTVFPLSPALTVAPGDDVTLTIHPRAVSNRDTYAWSAKRGSDTSGGDAMNSLVGGKAAMLAALGFVLRQPTLQRSSTFAHWQTALRADADSIEEMADALINAHPGDFTERSEAKDVVLDLLRKCDGLQLH